LTLTPPSSRSFSQTEAEHTRGSCMAYDARISLPVTSALPGAEGRSHALAQPVDAAGGPRADAATLAT
jgi:hypothetical protein